jgi:hypothetical protein
MEPVSASVELCCRVNHRGVGDSHGWLGFVSLGLRCAVHGFWFGWCEVEGHWSSREVVVNRRTRTFREVLSVLYGTQTGICMLLCPVVGATVTGELVEPNDWEMTPAFEDTLPSLSYWKGSNKVTRYTYCISCNYEQTLLTIYYEYPLQNSPFQININDSILTNNLYMHHPSYTYLYSLERVRTRYTCSSFVPYIFASVIPKPTYLQSKSIDP